MPDLEYKITTTADGSGATETAKDIDQLNKTAKEGTEAVSDLGVETERAAEKTSGFKMEARGLHSALFLIAREAGPAVGAAVAGAAALMTSGMLAAVLAVHELFNWIGQLRQRAEELRDQQAAMWIAVQKGAQDAADSASDFETKLSDARVKSDDLNASFSATTKVLDAQIEDHKKILKSLEAEQLAAAKGDAAQEAAVRQRFADFNQNYDLQAEQTKIEAERGHKQDLQIAAPFLAASAQGIEEMLEAAKNQNAIDQANLSDAGKGTT